MPRVYIEIPEEDFELDIVFHKAHVDTDAFEYFKTMKHEKLIKEGSIGCAVFTSVGGQQTIYFKFYITYNDTYHIYKAYGREFNQVFHIGFDNSVACEDALKEYVEAICKITETNYLVKNQITDCI